MTNRCAGGRCDHHRRVRARGHGRRWRAHQIDLATKPESTELIRKVKQASRSLDVAALIAGIGAGAEFASDTALSDELKIIDPNVRGTVQLGKSVVQDMVPREHRGIRRRSSCGRRKG